MAKLILLTGLPGVGKTTVATSLPSPVYERIHFGELLRRAVEARLGMSLSHPEFRERFYELVDTQVLDDATISARRHVAESTASVCVMDSHAITPTPLGFKVTPDDASRIRTLPFDAIVHLSSRGCSQRVLDNSSRDGRHAMFIADLAMAEQVQLSVCVFYASAHSCPLMIVDASGSPRETLRKVDDTVKALTGAGNREV